MILDVKLFARARDLAGAGVVQVQGEPGLTVAGLRVKLEAAHPRLAEVLSRCMIAVRGEYAEEEQTIAEGDELAVIPPVSGG